MRSLALDPLTGDLALAGGRLSLVEGVEAVAQRLRGRLSLWAGEWFADTSLGVPYLAVLGVKGAVSLAEATLRRAVVTCPGVATLDSFALVFDPKTRGATVAFRVRTVDGQAIEDNGFRVGA